jgi:dihydrofolate synthase/folylpolyglutamate synthase
VIIAKNLSEAIDQAVTLAEVDAVYGGGGVLVTGSIVLVGEAKEMMQKGRKHLQ